MTALMLVAVGLAALAIALTGVAFAGEPPALLRRHGPRITALALASAACLFMAPVTLTLAGPL